HQVELRRFLAEASTVLAASLDLEATLQRVADLAVPRLADICFLDVVEDDGSVRRVAAACADPARAEAVMALRDRYPPDLRWPHPIADALQTGHSHATPEVTEATLAELAPDPERRAVLRAL